MIPNYAKICASLVIASMLVPTAMAQGYGDIQLPIAISAAGAKTEDVLHNFAHNNQGGGGWGEYGNGYSNGETDSWANCQFALFTNSIVATIAVAESLALVSDDDDISREVFDTLGRRRWMPEPTDDNTTTSSDCGQDYGPILVQIEGGNGFGEPAPQGDGLASIASGLWAAPNGRNGGGVQVAIAAALAGGETSNVLGNDFMSYQGGGNGVFSAANCQTLVAWNSLVLTAGLAGASATATDDDVINVTIPDDMLGIQGEGGWEKPSWPENTLRESTSSCKQTFASITLVMDDDFLPPES